MCLLLLGLQLIEPKKRVAKKRRRRKKCSSSEDEWVPDVDQSLQLKRKPSRGRSFSSKIL